MKDKLFSGLGTVGVRLWFFISIFIYVLPIAMLGKPFLLNMVFFGIMYWFPPSSIIFWVWGLIEAIKGPQDIVAIIFYIAFVVMYLPFIVSILLSFFGKADRRNVLTALAFVIVLVAALFVDHIVDNKKLDEAYLAGYEAGYAALDLELRESGKTYIDGYVKGLYDR